MRSIVRVHCVVLGLAFTSVNCATGTISPSREPGSQPSRMGMRGHPQPGDEGAFPFTEDELVAGFALVEDIQTAREHARAVLTALQPDSDWAMAGETLLLLYVGSDSARVKIDHLRATGVL